MSKITVDRRLWLTVTDELVEDGQPDAAFLWASAGARVDEAEAARVGYRPGPTESSAGPLDADGVACPADGCDYSGSERGLKVHARVHAEG